MNSRCIYNGKTTKMEFLECLEIIKEKVILDNIEDDEIVVIVEVLEICDDMIMRMDLKSKKGVIGACGYGVVCFAGKSSKYQIGSRVFGEFGVQNICKLRCEQVELMLHIPKMDEKCQLSLLGSRNGLMAYCGLNYVVGRPAGTVLVTGGNSEVGIISCQLAKYYGCKVVGLVKNISDVRLELQELGIHVVDAQSESLDEEIKQVCPEGIDFVFHCGNYLPSSVYTNLNENSNAVICTDAISSKTKINEWKSNNSKTCTVKEFNMNDYGDKYQYAKAKLVYHYMMQDIKCFIKVENGIESFQTLVKKSIEGNYVGKLLLNLSKV